MPDYDPDLAKAELHQWRLLIVHHLRHIEAQSDIQTARLFLAEADRVAISAREVKRKIEKSLLLNRVL